MKKIESFEAYLRRTLSHQEFTDGLEDIFGSANMRTRVLNRPQRATHQQLLLISELTGISAWGLLKKWGVGIDKVSDLEKQNLQRLAEMSAHAA